MKEIPEILLIDKPKGITSFDVIRQLRKKLNTRKIGHAGTLDPLATGLMILGVNAGTKKLGEYLKLPKVYYTDILLGKQTETGDLEGKVIERKKIDESLKTQEVEDVLGSFLGETYVQGSGILCDKSRRKTTLLVCA
jgi:tRNA pseudouridine55 synthase